MNYLQIVDTMDQFVETYGVNDLVSDMTIVYGAAMVLNGFKFETSDIDIRCADHGFELIQERTGKVAEYYRGDKACPYINFGNIHIFSSKSRMVLDEVRAYQKEGYWVQTPSSILIEKLKRGRPKDLSDIEFICRRIDKAFIGNVVPDAIKFQ